VGGKYTGTPTACVGCHLTKYQQTTNPNHVSAGFPQDCTLCHSTSGWTPSSFNHNTSTKFPLTGKHTTVACASCHVGGKYAGTPTDCYSCHAAVYNSVTNPNHVAAGFPKTCATCHTTTTWAGATFTHNFPITSGAHKGIACTECHTSTSSYSSFVCTNCHTHDKTSMDSKHRGVRNYIYNSINCYSCHPNGKAG